VSGPRIPGHGRFPSAARYLVQYEGVGSRTRYCMAPCTGCKEDTAHYVGKCIHCGTISERIPDAPRKKILFGRGEAA
jgi:hypothetical protein